MTIWNARTLPYPLLAPWTDDYEAADFVVSVPRAILSNGKHINLTVKYNLTSEALRELIAAGQAQYIALFECRRTFSRNTYQPDQDDEFLLLLEAEHYAEELILTPYIVAKCEISGFISEEHADEFRLIRPEGFNISTGSILAVGRHARIALEKGGSPDSVIDLVMNPNIEKGAFAVDLDGNRIRIYVSDREKQQIETLRRLGRHSIEMAALFPAIYLHAVTEAIRHLSDPEYADMYWHHTIKKALEKHDIAVDDELLKSDALKYAQKLMEQPVGRLLTAYTNRDA